MCSDPAGLFLPQFPCSRGASQDFGFSIGYSACFGYKIDSYMMVSAITCQTKHRVTGLMMVCSSEEFCTPQSQRPLTIVSGPTSDLTKNGKTMHSALVNAIGQLLTVVV